MMRWIALAWIVAALLPGTAVASDEPATMTEQDVVQLLHVSGLTEEQIIERILASDVDFDLSEEMQDELEIAGISPRILAAMKRRQREMAPPPEPEADIVLPETGSTLTIRFNPDRKPGAEPATVRLINAMDRDSAAALNIKGSQPTITEVGLLVYCRTPDHVPDQWRSKSVVGRDFNAPRHAVLHFEPSSASEPASNWKSSLSKATRAKPFRESMGELEVLILEVPEQLEIPLEPGVAHDLSLALTIRVDGKGYLAMFDHWDAIVVEEGQARSIEAEFRGRRKNPLAARVEFRSSGSD